MPAQKEQYIFSQRFACRFDRFGPPTPTHKPLPRLRWALTHPTHNPPTSPCLPRSSAQCAWATQSLEPKWLLSQTFTP